MRSIKFQILLHGTLILNFQWISANSNGCDYYAPYRTLDGSCNNLNYPYWGSSPRTHSALLPLAYSDGKICPRSGGNMTRLPLARELSVNLMLNDNKNDDPNGLSQLHIYYGMFVAHDFALSYPTDNVTVNYPCPKDTTQCNITKMYVGNSPNPRNEFKNLKCIEVGLNLGMFCPSTPNWDCGCSTCKSGQYQQRNYMTSYIDLSNVYSIRGDTNQNIRNGPKFQVTPDNLIPVAPEFDYDLSAVPCVQKDNTTTGPCLYMGEQLGNLASLLQPMGTLFLRHHNTLVDQLSPYFNGETLYQEARRLNIAIFQHILYAEYLPTVLGACMSGDLKVPTAKYQYNPKIDATVTKEFVTGAFRFGHSQPQDFGTLGSTPHSIPIGQLYTLIPYETAGPTVIEQEVTGMLNDRAKETNNYYNDQQVNNLIFGKFEIPGDLAAIDVQRGRLHGINPYVAYRRYFGLSVPQTYQDLAKLMPTDIVNKMNTYYGPNGVPDIDLHLAALAENKVSNCAGTLLGPTYHCIVEDQFRKAKYGDRFWYEILGQPWSFTTEQINQIAKSTLSSVICQTTTLKQIQSQALIATSPMKDCQTIVQQAAIDFSYWNYH